MTSATGGTQAASGGSDVGAGGQSGGGGPSGTGGSGAERTDLVHADFEGATPGPYAQADVENDFGAAPTWNNGLNEGRAVITAEDGNQFLRVTYPGGQFGPAQGGVQFKVALGGSYDELYFSYRVRFAAGFDFVKGGKLPGLVGGTSPTGCSPDPDGFSARNMWRTGGAAVQYVYYPTQPNNCGDDLAYESGGAPKLFTPGAWQTVEHRIVMNTPGQSDGILQAWVDGELVFSDTARLWRNAGAAFGIDTLYFSTFFGGGDDSWAPESAQIIDFDDLIVADGRIGP